MYTHSCKRYHYFFSLQHIPCMLLLFRFISFWSYRFSCHTIPFIFIDRWHNVRFVCIRKGERRDGKKRPICKSDLLVVILYILFIQYYRPVYERFYSSLWTFLLESINVFTRPMQWNRWDDRQTHTPFTHKPQVYCIYIGSCHYDVTGGKGESDLCETYSFAIYSKELVLVETQVWFQVWLQVLRW